MNSNLTMPSPLVHNNLRSVLCPPTTLEAWTFTEQELEEAISGKRILNPSLDLSNACNLNCPYCFVEPVDSLQKKCKPTELSLGEIKQVIAIFADLGARTVNLIGAGEPLIDPNFTEVVQHVTHFGMRVLVATNGLELVKNPHLIDLLHDINASVVIKLNSFSPDIEDRMVGRSGYSAIRDKALACLLESGFARDKPTRLGANAVITKGNQSEIPSIHKYCRDHNICYAAGPYMPTGRTEGSGFHGHAIITSAEEENILKETSGGTLDQLRTELSRWDAEHGFPVIENAAYTSGLPCTQSLGVYVDIQGMVWHCPAKQQFIKGRLKSSPLITIQGSIVSLPQVQTNTYLSEHRYKYNGSCPYKLEQNMKMKNHE